VESPYTKKLCESESARASLLPYKEALENILRAASPAEHTELVALSEALHRILAVPLKSNIDVPPLDNSAMDGYAINSADVEGEGEFCLSVSQRIAAGEVGSRLQAGTAARIFTGAPIPEGADAVVMQENAALKDGNITFKGPYKANTNVRFAAEDIRQGEQLLESGTRLRAQEIGVAASTGHTELEVFKRIKVGVFFTGDELIEPGQKPGPGQIYDSNRYTIVGLLKTMGCKIVDLGIVGDTFDATRDAFKSIAGQVDLIVTSGGVSVGEEDHVRAAVEALGKLDMWRVKIKPGKPLAFGQLKGTPFLGLPGNPVSVFVTFCLFVSPFIKRLQGMHTVHALSIGVKADFTWRAGSRREFVRARLVSDEEGQSVAQIFRHQGSGVLASTVWSDGLVMIPDGLAVSPGDWVDYTPFSNLLV
jgi:molybdopterin molybdotransferase